MTQIAGSRIGPYEIVTLLALKTRVASFQPCRLSAWLGLQTQPKHTDMAPTRSAHDQKPSLHPPETV